MRSAHRGDLQGLADLRAAWRGTTATPEFRREFAAWHDDEGSDRWYWVALDDADEPVGMVTLRLFTRMPSPAAPPSRWGYLANLFVLPSHRNRGLGGDLIDALVDWSAEEGLVRVVLSPSTRSRPLYTRHRFAPADGLLVRELGLP